MEHLQKDDLDRRTETLPCIFPYYYFLSLYLSHLLYLGLKNNFKCYMNLDKKSTKKVKKADLGISLLLIVGILIVVNFFSYQLFYRWDLTENKVFSISEASKKTVGELDDIVNIKAYFSSTLPSQVLSLKQEVNDILAEYEAFSDGRIKIEFIDPTDNAELARELQILGIPQLTFEVYEKDKLQLVNGYMGIAVSHGASTEVIPAVKQNTSDLEYQITTAIKKVTVDEIATIGYLSSHGTPVMDAELRAAKQELEELYTVLPIDLPEENPGINPGIDTLIILGPSENFSEDQQKALNDFLVRGGALLVLADGVSIGEGLLATKNTTGLETLLSGYGITLNQDLVGDTRSGMASFTQGFITFSSNYAFWPKINSQGFNQDSSAVSNLENVILPWSSSVEIDTSKINEGEFSYLANTTSQGWQVTENFNTSPNNANIPQGDRKTHYLAAFVNGSLPNPYFEADSGNTNDRFNGRIVVVGDSDFARDNFLRNSPDNLTLFLNLVDILSFDEDLITIRSKGVTSRPIKELSDSSKATIRYTNIFGLTIMVIAFGLIRYFMRRRSRFVDDL